MKRGQARELLMQLLYQMSIHDDFDISNKEKFEKEFQLNKQQEYFSVAFNQIINHKEDIDKLISANLKKWKLDRIPKVDLAILRLAVAEIKYMETIPNSVSINEAVELAKKFGNEDSSKFINGVLGKIASYGDENDSICSGDRHE